MVEPVETQVQRNNLEHTNIWRWEDDGGQAIEYRHPADHSKPEAARGNNPPNDTARERGIGETAVPLRAE
jgi:hypothetical protein